MRHRWTVLLFLVLVTVLSFRTIEYTFLELRSLCRLNYAKMVEGGTNHGTYSHVEQALYKFMAKLQASRLGISDSDSEHE